MDDNILLEMKDLHVSFSLDEGIVRAVEGVDDLTIAAGKSWASSAKAVAVNR